MANDLASYRDAVELILDDPSNLRYSTAQIDQVLRLALQEYNIFTQETATLKDLDAATATTIPLTDAPIFQLQAAGFALLSRAASQLEANVLQEDASNELRALGQIFLDSFRRLFRPVLASPASEKMLADYQRLLQAPVRARAAVLKAPPSDTF